MALQALNPADKAGSRVAPELFPARGRLYGVGIKRVLGAVLVALSLAACRAADVDPVSSQSQAPTRPSQNPCSGYTCDGPGAQLNVGYPYRLFTHCGVFSTRFDGRAFYVEAIDPSTVTTGLNNPEDLGRITLVSPHVAVFRSSAGNPLRFVDSPPGVIGQPYPFRVYVLSGGSQLIDRGFAGRLWRAQGTLPGAVGAPYGNGQDRYPVVEGTMTLTGSGTAVFQSSTGARVQFAPVGTVLCD